MKKVYILLFLFFSLITQASNLNGGGDELTIAPNPAVSYTNIISNEPNKQIKDLYVYNVLGKQVIRVENISLTTKYTMDVSKLREGMYIVKVFFSDETSAVSTLIKANY